MKKKNRIHAGKPATPWTVKVFFITFLLSFSMSIISETLMSVVSILPAVVILMAVICIGILFDIMGVAVTTADPVPFRAMASRKIPGAMAALSLINHADRVSNVCNDVVGDICGIVSGASGATIALELGAMIANDPSNLWVSVMISSCVAALTVGGKAMGKSFAMTRSKDIVLRFGRVIALFQRSR